MSETMLWERLELAEERINTLGEDSLKSPEWDLFFAKGTALLKDICKVYHRVNELTIAKVPVEELKAWNRELYADILPENYGESFANPTYAAACFGLERGQIMSALAAELRSAIPYAYETNLSEIVIRAELFLEIYSAVRDAWEEEKSEPECETLRRILYWYASDYSEPESLQRVAEMVDPNLNFAADILLMEDLSNPDYLYRYGEYVTENEIAMAKFMAELPQETIDTIADTFSEGYRIGFVNTGKDLGRKETVNIRYPLGFERVVRRAHRNFEVMGLKSVIYRAGSSVFRRQGTHKVGYFGANPNKQYDYDHKEDEALFLDGQFITRKAECLKAAFEEYKQKAGENAGPAVIEIFGEKPFVPEVKKEALRLSEEQQKLSVKYASLSGQITNEYIKGEERSFTIIAFPVPDIGANFEEIFRQTIRINTLDYKTYQQIQQTLIDALDEASYVRVKGCGGNKTDLTVSLTELKDATAQTKFENCVADVNIPVGEVFTSPVLKGTEGVLHVSRVYLNELEYRDLELTVKDGMITGYDCKNFESEEENKKYIRDNVLFHHDSLPMGEFAIGTNTTAYAVGHKYDIAAKFPILIAEKTGPHFAFGDTCYSHAEDIKVYNPDGKEIIARDNEISILRKTEPEKAYFHCHTDITIPYDELGSIAAVSKDGEETMIIQDGRFVLPGCEELNKAFSEENV